jgi:general transcription factor IIIA
MSVTSLTKEMSLSPVLSATSVRGASSIPSPFILHLSATSESEYEPTLNPIANTSRQPVIVNGKLLLNPKRIYKCTFEGCDKSYAKPSRLEEHERSHTGHVRQIEFTLLRYRRADHFFI